MNVEGRNFNRKIFSCIFIQTDEELTKTEKNILMCIQLKRQKNIKLIC